MTKKMKIVQVFRQIWPRATATAPAEGADAARGSKSRLPPGGGAVASATAAARGRS